ncbi:MAG: JAB domain-containing protein [Nitrospiraceae bacterium]|nr:MAG: JAB domain-containing protein [Nitrospiraceae bacterium]
MSYKSIKDWPEDERPRERLLSLGAANLSAAQLLAIILRTGGGGKSAMDLAMEMLDFFKNLKNIENASIKELASFKGMGHAKAAQIKAAFELGRRLFMERDSKGPVFSSSNDVYSYYYPLVRDFKKEILFCAMLDAKNRIFMNSKVSEGTLTNSLIHPREAFKSAIKESAASVIFIHNHPSGDPAPSREDIAITERLMQTGEIVGIKVLDHVIIGDSRHTSLIDDGYVKRI